MGKPSALTFSVLGSIEDYACSCYELGSFLLQQSAVSDSRVTCLSCLTRPRVAPADSSPCGVKTGLFRPIQPLSLFWACFLGCSFCLSPFLLKEPESEAGACSIGIPCGHRFESRLFIFQSSSLLRPKKSSRGWSRYLAAATPVEDPDGIPGSWFQPLPAPAIAVIWE